MATSTITNRENLVVAAKMTHNQEIIDVAEVLNETNDVIEDAIVQRGNDITSHVVSRRTRLPGVNWVKVGNGWNATVGLVGQVREEMGMLKARFLAPQDVVRLQPDPAKYRMQQERAYIESMGQELSNTLFGNFAAGSLSPTAAPPEEFAGFQYRYNALGSSDSNFVISNGNTAGGTTDNTSAWFVQWGASRVYLIHPRNTDGGGLKKEDKGLVYTSGDNSVASTTASNPNPTNSLWAFITEFAWDVGLCVEDARSVKRLCNIDSVVGATNSINPNNVIRIRNNFKGNDMISMYVNENVFTQLDIAAKDKVNVFWSENNPFGRPQLFFRDMPVRRCDSISNVEGVIS
jgi:hypothetical protein